MDKVNFFVFPLDQVDGDLDEVGTWDADSQRILFYSDEAAIAAAAEAPTSSGEGVPRPDSLAEGVPPEEEADAETLEIFCSATGADEETGRRFISEAGGDLEQAIDLFYADENLDIGEAVEAQTSAAPVVGPASDDIVVTFSQEESGRLGVNFGEKGVTWPTVESITPNSLAARKPMLSVGLILHAVEGVAGRRVVESSSFEEGIQFILQAGRPMTLTFKRGVLLGGGEADMGRGSELRQLQKRNLAQKQAVEKETSEKRRRREAVARRRAAFPQGVSQLLVLGDTDSLLVARDYRKDLGELGLTELAALFVEEIGRRGSATPPVLMTKRGLCFIHILSEAGGLRFVFVTRHNCFPSVCLELLGQLSSLVEQYCGDLSEESIRSNQTLILELFDEVIDFGLPQMTEGSQLVNYVFGSTREKPPTAANWVATAASPMSKLTVAAEQNELFVDVVEQISATFEAARGGEAYAAAVLQHAELDGTIWLKSYLQGRPEVRFVFDKELLIGEQALLDGEDDEQEDDDEEEELADETNGIPVDDAVFHDCVFPAPAAELTSLRVLRVRPPPALEIAAMRYRVALDRPSALSDEQQAARIRLPFAIATKATMRPLDGGEADEARVLDASICLDAVFPDEHDAEDVCIRIMLPRAATGCDVRADNMRGPTGVEGERTSVGPADVTAGDAQRGGQAVFWRMASVRGPSKTILRML